VAGSLLFSKKGFTLLELLIVNCIISIVTAVVILVYFSQKDKAYEIILLHDLNNFSNQLQVDYLENNSISLEKGDIITQESKNFTISNNVKFEIIQTEKNDSLPKIPVLVKASLKNQTIYFDLKNKKIKNISGKKSYNNFKLVKFFKYFLYVLGGSFIFVYTIIYILKIGSIKK
jgi:prepilin-type N-terminal cleavage/methylation domain-containing protein